MSPAAALDPRLAAQVRREEQLKAECKLLRAIYRAAKDFLDNRPGGTARGLEVTAAVYEAWLTEPNAPRRRSAR